MSSENLHAHHHGRDADRNDLTGEHRLGDTIQLVLLFVFLAVWILDSFIFRFSDFLVARIPWFIRFPLGIILLLISLSLARTGLKKVFGETRDEPQVITEGVFSIVRHPIYLGAILLYMGLICITLSLVSAAVWIIIILFYRFISRHEEKLLIRRFGDEYLNYMKSVPMLFPLKLRR
jgi:protein-S-isoprenylcysteine O-methyltransferase Ste14